MLEVGCKYHKNFNSTNVFGNALTFYYSLYKTITDKKNISMHAEILDI